MTEPTGRTFGVEEEYLLVDALTGEAFPGADDVMAAAKRRGADAEHELLASQVEIGTPVHTTLDDVRASLHRLRQAIAEAAVEAGCRLAAMGTHPWASIQPQAISEGARYGSLAEELQRLGTHLVICGCHVHVGVDDAEVALRAALRARPWLPVLLALSANSPFWEGADTGFASYRTTVFSRLPTAGPLGDFADRAEHAAVIADLIRTGVIKDQNMMWTDIRPSYRYSTVEVRVADVCTELHDAVLIAGLCRALISTCAAEVTAGAEPRRVRYELLRAATWRAARSGLAGALVDLQAMKTAPAPEVVASFVEHVRPALEEAGDFAEISELVARTLADGGGAARQRLASQQAGGLRHVVADAVQRTYRPFTH
jgi:carboxylate-amine ligase